MTEHELLAEDLERDLKRLGDGIAEGMADGSVTPDVGNMLLNRAQTAAATVTRAFSVCREIFEETKAELRQRNAYHVLANACDN